MSRRHLVLLLVCALVLVALTSIWISSKPELNVTKTTPTTSSKSTDDALLLTHVINVFEPTDDRGRSVMSLVARSITEALRQAPTVRVELLLVADAALSKATIREVFPVDYSIADVQISTNLTRSSLDFVTVFGARASVLKLPLLADIFDIAHRHGRGNFIVFTNTDIIPAPDFYSFVARRAQEMHPRHGPSLDITRRDINATADIDMQELHQLSGLPHPGRDCWVFPRAWAPKLSLSSLFLGFRYAEPLLINLHYFSRHHAHKAHQQVTRL